MDPDLNRALAQWLRAEEALDDDASDAAFGELMRRTDSAPLPSVDFAATTLTRVAAAVRADAERNRRLRRTLAWTGTAAALVLLYFGSGVLFSVFSSLIVGALNLVVSLVVWIAEGGTARGGMWSTVTGMGRAVAAFAAEPRVTFAILVFQAAAAAALVILHRVLGADREWLE